MAAITYRPPRSRPWSRVMGLTSVYAKTVRDSRRAGLLVGTVAALFMLATAAPFATEFTTPVLRAQLAATMTSLPVVIQGLLGEPINIDTLGGFMSWRVGNILPVLLGIWAVIALSGTLAGEAAKGSLDLLLSTGHARRSLAIQKVLGFVTVLIAAMLIAAAGIVMAGLAFYTLPGDEIPVSAALGQVTLYGLLMLAAGSVSFATAPLLGRTRAMGLGFVTLFGSYLISSYGTLSPAIDALSPLSWYSWTAGHRPMAGVTDWPSLAVLAIVTVGLLVAGVLSFERRDIGSYASISWLRLPGLPAGIRGPFTRQLADRTGIAIAWGAGVGLYAAMIAASAQAFTESILKLPGIVDMINSLYPDIDLSQPSGILQLAFFAFGSLMIGLAAASFLAGWSSDEGKRRLDVVMSAPVSRVGWALRSGAGVLAAVGVSVLVLGLMVAGAVASQGGKVGEPVLGALILGIAVMGFAGIGLAVGGVFRASWAAPAAALAVIATFVLDTLGAALDLPDVVLDLSIYKHLGQPMAGTYDPVGIVVAIGLAVGGLSLGALGFRRRDIGE